jgi:hypothetical protein
MPAAPTERTTAVNETPQPRLQLGSVTQEEAELAIRILDNQLASLANWMESAVLNGRSDSATQLAAERVQTRNIRSLFGRALREGLDA